jgi:hypothetical protein
MSSIDWDKLDPFDPRIPSYYMRKWAEVRGKQCANDPLALSYQLEEIPQREARFKHLSTVIAVFAIAVVLLPLKWHSSWMPGAITCVVFIVLSLLGARAVFNYCIGRQMEKTAACIQSFKTELREFYKAFRFEFASEEFFATDEAIPKKHVLDHLEFLSGMRMQVESPMSWIAKDALEHAFEKALNVGFVTLSDRRKYLFGE